MAAARTVGVGAPVTTLLDGPGASEQPAATAEGVAAAVTADVGVDAAAAATAAEPGAANEAAAAAECVAEEFAPRPRVNAAAAAPTFKPGAANEAVAAAVRVSSAVAARLRVDTAAAASAADVGAAAGGVTFDGVSPTIMTSSCAATPPVAETSAASPKVGGALTVLVLVPLAAPSAATDASAAALDGGT